MLKHLAVCDGREAFEDLRRALRDQHREIIAYGSFARQYLMLSGKTLFKGMTFADLHRVQLDIETTTLTPDQQGARILMIALSDTRGYEAVLDGDEKQILEQLIERIQALDPDVIIEITLPSTKSKDTKDNLLLYSKVFRTREYYWYDEGAGELAGYRLQGDDYVPIVPSARGWLWSEVLGVWLGVSDAPFLGWRYRWLRFYREDGSLVLTGEEAERQRAEQERLLREQAEQRLAELEAELKRLRGEQ